MSLTNEKKYVTVRRLNRFKEKLNAQVYPDMTGATSSAAGAKGLVPAPAAGDNDKFLKGDGTWSDDLPRASFVGTTLVFSSGGTFSGTTLVLG